MITVILNPSARSERAQQSLATIERLAKDADIRFTRGAGDARVIAAEAAASGAKTIVACGGDGTVNEAANGVADALRRNPTLACALGVMPVGTMNVFAKELGLPSTLEAAWDVITAGQTRELDLPSASGTHFVQLAGVGFDAQVVKETTWESKKRFGPLSYFMSAAHVATLDTPRLVVSTAGTEREAALVLIGNGRYYGAKLALFPDARPDDGLLDVLIFKKLGYLDIVRYLAAMLVGHHTDLDDVEYLQTAKLGVRCENGSVPVELDGELFGDAPVKFETGVRLKVVC